MLCINIECSDKILSIKPNKLNYKYFNDLISRSGGISQFRKEKTSLTGEKYVYDVYEVPRIKVECSASILRKLLSGEHYMFCGQYEEIAELLYYNYKYGINCKISIDIRGFDPSYHLDIL